MVDLIEGCFDDELKVVKGKLNEADKEEEKKMLTMKQDMLMDARDDHTSKIRECLEDSELDFENDDVTLEDVHEALEECREESRHGGIINTKAIKTSVHEYVHGFAKDGPPRFLRKCYEENKQVIVRDVDDVLRLVSKCVDKEGKTNALKQCTF